MPAQQEWLQRAAVFFAAASLVYVTSKDVQRTMAYNDTPMTQEQRDALARQVERQRQRQQ